MKVTCSDCGNSWDMTNADMPAGTGDFEASCPQCGSNVAVKRENAAASDNVQWYVAFGRERKGPFTAESVAAMISTGEVTNAGFVWRQGFDNWKKASEIPEFADAFAARAGSGQAGAASSDGMVWQRRETSVLFSLDDYKQKKATRGTSAVKEADVVDVRPLDEEPAPVRVSAAGPIGMISFDESEVQRVAEALARKKKNRRRLLSGVIAVAVLVLVGAGAFIASQVIVGPDRRAVPMTPEQAASPTPQQAAQPAPQQAAQPAPQQAAQPAPEQQAAGQAAQEARPEQKPDSENVAVDRKPDAAVDRKAEAKAAKEAAKAARDASRSDVKADAKTDPRAAKEAAKADQKPEKEAEKPAPKPAPASGGNDASSLLAQLHKGKDKEEKDDKAASAGSSGLPDRLTVSQVSGAFARKKDAMRNCVVESGEAMPYKAQAKVEIEGSGKVASVAISGGGAARACLEGVLRSVTFDKFSGPSMKVPYTVSVR